MQRLPAENPSLNAVLIGSLIVAAITLFRAVILYTTPMQLFFDEAQYWSWGTTLDFGYFSKPPVLAWVIRGFTEVCGTGEACIRLGSPVLYGLTALLVGFLAARVTSRMGGNASSGFLWGALLFATIPGITFAARLISTDAPLLFFFAVALLALDCLKDRKSAVSATVLGLAIGFGLMSKYAMIYFVIGMIIWLFVSSEGRRVIFSPVMLLVPLFAVLVIAPNIWWNAANDWITFQHTGDNAKWQGLNLKFDNMAEFIAAQIGIIGPLLFLTLVIGLWRFRKNFTPDVAFLLSFSLPVLLLMVTQATISRAHANWAAVAFIALTVLTTSWAVSWRAKPLLVGAIITHVLALLALAGADSNADKLVATKWGAPYKRVFGWVELAERVKELAEREGAKTVVADRRNSVAQLLYYLRDSNLVVRTWAPQGLPANHYEMAAPLSEKDAGPVLVAVSCEAGNLAADIKALDQIAISVRERHTLRLNPFLASDATVRPKDIC